MSKHNRYNESKQYQCQIRRNRRKSQAIIACVCLSFCLMILFIVFCDIPSTTVNIAVGLIVFNSASWLLLRLLVRPSLALGVNIPLKNNGSQLWRNGELYYRAVEYDRLTCPIPPEYLTRIDEQQIIIDNDSTGGRIFIFLLSSILFYTFIHGAFLSDTTVFSQLYGEKLLFGEIGVMLALIMAYTLMNPRNRIVFDRVSKTVTIPGKFLMSKTETIPYNQAALSIRKYPKVHEFYILIFNSERPTHGRSIMPGYIDEALRLARFIKLYMEKEIPDISELKNFKNREKPQQEEMEYFNTW